MATEKKPKAKENRPGEEQVERRTNVTLRNIPSISPELDRACRIVCSIRCAVTREFVDDRKGIITKWVAEAEKIVDSGRSQINFEDLHRKLEESDQESGLLLLRHAEAYREAIQETTPNGRFSTAPPSSVQLKELKKGRRNEPGPYEQVLRRRKAK